MRRFSVLGAFPPSQITGSKKSQPPTQYRAAAVRLRRTHPAEAAGRTQRAKKAQTTNDSAAILSLRKIDRFVILSQLDLKKIDPGANDGSEAPSQKGQGGHQNHANRSKARCAFAKIFLEMSTHFDTDCHEAFPKFWEGVFPSGTSFPAARANFLMRGCR